MAALFEGKQLLTKDGLKSASEVLDGKFVALYFSAHWCPPCRGFTPKLAEWYKADLQAKGIEVVFVSSDKDEDAFTSYYGEQPWTALPFAERELKAKLSQKFKVSGIPSLVILEKNGETLTDNGRAKVSGDPKGANFPDGWRPKTRAQVLDEMTVVDAAGTETKGAPASRYLGVYFSAHWCPPCKNFTPKFASAYKAVKAAGHDLEVVFVSADQDEAQFKEYFATMPWKALEFGHDAKDALDEHFGVEGIPHLVILENVGGKWTTVNDDAVSLVSGDEAGEKFPWAPPLVWDAAETGLGPINELPCVIGLAEHADDAATAHVTKVMNEVATALAAEDKAAGKEAEVGFIMFPSAEDRCGAIGQRVREKVKPAGVGEKDACVVMMALGASKCCKLAAADLAAVTAPEMTSWVKGYLAGSVETTKTG